MRLAIPLALAFALAPSAATGEENGLRAVDARVTNLYGKATLYVQGGADQEIGRAHV